MKNSVPQLKLQIIIQPFYVHVWWAPIQSTVRMRIDVFMSPPYWQCMCQYNSYNRRNGRGHNDMFDCLHRPRTHTIHHTMPCCSDVVLTWLYIFLNNWHTCTKVSHTVYLSIRLLKPVMFSQICYEEKR